MKFLSTQRLRHNARRLERGAWRHFRRWSHHPFGLPIIVFLGAVALGAILLLVLSVTHTTTTFHPDTSYIAIIRHDGETQTVPTNEPTVAALLKALNIPVGAHDRIEPSLDTPIAQDNFRVNVYRAVPVTISDGSTVFTANSAAATPRSVVTEAGVQLYAEDEVQSVPAMDLVAEQSLGEHIVVTRSVPITLNNYGAVLPLRTHAATVAQLLSDVHIKLTPADTVIPDASTPVTAGLQVFVNRKGTQIVTQTTTIPAPVQVVEDDTLSFGTSATRQAGSPGTQVTTWQVNGTQRTLLQTVVTVPPVPQIVAHGKAVSIPADKQAVMAQAGIASSDYAYVDYIASHEGGWCPTKIQGTHNCPGYIDPSSVPAHGGYGIFQATPGSKMASAGSDWAVNPVTQIRWATGYAVGRYGSWAGAYNHWSTAHSW